MVGGREREESRFLADNGEDGAVISWEWSQFHVVTLSLTHAGGASVSFGRARWGLEGWQAVGLAVALTRCWWMPVGRAERRAGGSTVGQMPLPAAGSRGDLQTQAPERPCHRQVGGDWEVTESQCPFQM